MEITRSFSLFSLLFYLRTGKFAIRWGIGEWWHWIGLQFFFFFFWERNWRLEIKNFSFRNFYFFFRKGETTKNLFIFRLLECVITIRFCGKKFHWNEIKKLDGFLSRMRDISWNFELRILFVPSMLNSPPFLSFWFIFFRRLSTGRRTKTQGTR